MRLSPEEHKTEVEIINIKNPLQKELIEESNTDAIEWVNKYGKTLDEILREPEMEELLDPSHHDELKQKIKERLYH